MNGYYFFVCCWALFIYSTFLMEKQSSHRVGLALSSLIAIIVSPFYIYIGSIQISWSSFMILFYFLFRLQEMYLKEKLYILISSIGLSMLYSGLHLIELYDPVMIMINRDLFYIFVCVCYGLILFSISEWASCLCTLYIGSFIGEVVIYYVLNSLGFQYVVADMSYLDIFSVCLILLASTGKIAEIMKELTHHILTNKENTAYYE
ncbi:hypothetical protein Q73_08235 [Bacillus coahuilensis m2-6]|uniref:YphA family membrane protein n=1 Tax=Bacillus coahuilensis TaxID=408580 RepID=UPI0007501B46|nr:hypothetical protein [Bacillus coahuilensis]KUP07789.1 hypothetical protein Q73_08235 [Bacillus coahuilensis m2-6]